MMGKETAEAERLFEKALFLFHTCYSAENHDIVQDRSQIFCGTVSPFLDARLLCRACGRFLKPVGFSTFSSRHFQTEGKVFACHA